jgi:hypothetical protein
MAALTPLQAVALRAQAETTVRMCEARRRLNSNFSIIECLENGKARHEKEVGRIYSDNGKKLNEAMDILSAVYNPPISRYQTGGKRRTRKRSSKKRSTKKRNTARHTRKGR